MAEEKKAEAAPAPKKDGAPPSAAPEDAPASASGGGKGPLIIAIASLIIMPVAGWAVVYFTLKTPAKAGTEAKADPHAEPAKDGHGDKPEGKAKDSEKKDDPAADPKAEGKDAKLPGKGKGTFEIVVNVANTRGTRFLRAGLYFKAPDSVIEEMEKPVNRAMITDIIRATLSSKRLDELEAPDICSRLRSDIIITVNTSLKVKKDKIEDLYFTDFVIQ